MRGLFNLPMFAICDGIAYNASPNPVQNLSFMNILLCHNDTLLEATPVEAVDGNYWCRLGSFDNSSTDKESSDRGMVVGPSYI